jgi:hypothetical protein
LETFPTSGLEHQHVLHTDYWTVETFCKTESLGYLVILFLSFIQKFQIFMEVHIYWGVSPVTPFSLLSVISFAGVYCVSDVTHNSLAYNVAFSVLTICSMADMYQHSA